ncbi:S-layer homology domain-containing protein [Cohnella endophytica]|uniref:S-layer homology domain-containing protein n=1 Tax=Cohnella endophytica TaxID=2419778 RepID=A0A494XU07_9BACL|nr:S-layer homology domain-containing protein [Cohnella endophytica]RKP51604.1 S-layer homology domain-containing protein [Cohnella endophytica]
MRHLRKTVTSLLLVIALLIGTVANAAAFSDVSATNWASKQIQEWADKGLVKGYSDGTFKPNGAVTRVEFMALVNGGFGYTEEKNVSFSDVKAGSWAEGVVKKAVAAGYIGGFQDGTMKPEQPISRAEAAVVLTKIAKLEGNVAGASAFKDAIPAWAKAAVGAVALKGYVKGYADGTFGASKSITRAEAIVVLDRVLKDQTAPKPAEAWTIDKAGTYGPTEGKQAVAGDVVITAAGVTLQNVTIAGKLTIAESVGEGDVFLKGVTVKGDAVINGGGENSIHVDDTVFVNATVNKKTGKIRIVVRGGSNIANITIDSNTLLDLGDTVTVGQAVLNAVAKVIGAGKIANAIVNISGVSFETAPTNVKTADGVQAPTITPPVIGGGGGGSIPTPDTTPPVIASIAQTIAVGGAIWVTSNEAATLYLVPAEDFDGSEATTNVKLEAAVTAGKGLKAPATANKESRIVTNAETEANDYVVYAVDAAGNVSNASATMEIVEMPVDMNKINSVNDLVDLADFDSDYILTADIDFAEYNKDHANGLAPLGNEDELVFNGDFIGNGFVIKNLKIVSSDRHVGLFGQTGGNALLYDLRLTAANVESNWDENNYGTVGGLVGYSNGGNIQLSSVSGSVKGTGYAFVGGLVGESSGNILNSSTNVEVHSASDAGGLAGDVYGAIENSFATGNVTSTDSYVGGLAGYTTGSINTSYATGSVIGVDYVGGLIGCADDGMISNSHASGTVNGIESVGGLVGDNYVYITDSYATGNVTGEFGVGGFLGDNYAYITNSYTAGNVKGEFGVGGFVGENNGMVAGSHASGAVIGQTNVGGLIGKNSNTVMQSYAIGAVNGTGDNAGGLVGFNDSSISNSYATGDVTGNTNVGGLTGTNQSVVQYSYASGKVTGFDYVGGLVGFTDSDTVTINHNYVFSSAIAATATDAHVGRILGTTSQTTFEGNYALGTYTGDEANRNSNGADLSQVDAWKRATYSDNGWSIDADNEWAYWNINEGSGLPYLLPYIPQ